MAEETYLKVEPFHVQEVLEFSLKKSPGSHVVCELQLLLTHEGGESDQKSIKEQTELTVGIGSGEPLFKGLIASVRYVEDYDGIYAQVLGVSRTCLLDEKRICRSYQDINMTYRNMVEKIRQRNSGSDCIFSLENDEPVGEFLLQYQETDWSFLNRLASRLHIPVIPEAVSDRAAFYFDVPQREASEFSEEVLRRNYQVSYSPGVYRDWKENGEKGVTEKAVAEYFFEFDANQGIAVGDNFSFDGKKLFVRSVLSYLRDHVLTHQISCTEREGFFVKTFYNSMILGLSLKGRVCRAVEDKVEIYLYEIDPEEENPKYPFTYLTSYAAEGNGGWYFMPENGDTVFLRFPTMMEKDAVADGSIRTQEEKEDQILNPEIKYIRTADGQEIMLTEDEIKISTKEKDLFIRISEKSGIEISSNQAIEIRSEKEIQMSAKAGLRMQADQELKLEGKSCEITMGSEMKLKGNVKIN